MAMISAMIGSARFHFRAAGVWLVDGHVLLQGDTRADYWALPGGRVEIMESAEDALRRELQEELEIGDDTHVERLLWITQNFFYWPELGGDQHELGLYFIVRPGPGALARYADLTRVYPCAEPDSTITFRWFPLAELAGVIRPTFLASALRDLPEHPTIITHQDH
ncbi:MAG TPA: NUDIX domain-containing protein [Ktedonobacterales bacterium]|nr:NUDIX domain-containing protein [Ktedonobacterales bacterium]